MSTYLVGVDGSDKARDALSWAQSIAAPDDSIIALHAWEVPVVTGYEAAVVVDTTTIEQAARDFLEGMVANDERVEGRLVTGHPGHALVDVAKELGAEATIVVGHAGSGKASLLLGSTANYAIHHTHNPVVVVRGECRLPVRTVAVGIDEERGGGHDPDAPSLAALRWALTRSGVERIEVHHADFVPGVAAGPIVEPGLESEVAAADDERGLRDAITRAIGECGARSNTAEIVPVVSAGTGAFALIEASRQVDLVVIGTHGRRGLVELIRGSTSLEVTAHAHCPVAVAH